MMLCTIKLYYKSPNKTVEEYSRFRWVEHFLVYEWITVFTVLVLTMSEYYSFNAENETLDA